MGIELLTSNVVIARTRLGLVSALLHVKAKVYTLRRQFSQVKYWCSVQNEIVFKKNVHTKKANDSEARSGVYNTSIYMSEFSTSIFWCECKKLFLLFMSFQTPASLSDEKLNKNTYCDFKTNTNDLIITVPILFITQVLKLFLTNQVSYQNGV